MSIKSKILNIVTVHPKLVTLGISLVITFGVGIAAGMMESQQAHALTQSIIQGSGFGFGRCRFC